MQVGRHLALSRVAPKFPVDDLARLAAVAPRVAAAADGEGALILSREGAADVARPPTPPPECGAPCFVTVFPRFALALQGYRDIYDSKGLQATERSVPTQWST